MKHLYVCQRGMATEEGMSALYLATVSDRASSIYFSGTRVICDFTYIRNSEVLFMAETRILLPGN
jgi:hypothetical protein